MFFCKGTTESRRCWSGSDRQTDVPRFISEERCLALRLCGWISRGPDINVETFLRSLEQEHEWERAAAIALFNLDIRRAIQILNKGATAENGESSRGLKVILSITPSYKSVSCYKSKDPSPTLLSIYLWEELQETRQCTSCKNAVWILSRMTLLKVVKEYVVTGKTSITEARIDWAQVKSCGAQAKVTEHKLKAVVHYLKLWRTS